ncbi:hypothetical protein AB0N31_04610 [Streptomyces sp. NPDC051051]|uniref:hypothetical protein n=1 Tax=Streptomyces sp. NPDC051051 TaxID=3155666 RepID=UPI003432F703
MSDFGGITFDLSYATEAERLADSLGQVVKQQAHSRAAARAAQHLVTENGAGQVLKAVQRLTDG